MTAERVDVHVTYDANRGGYVATCEALQTPLVAPSLGSVRRKIESG
jgi:hypothetical protein